MTIENQDIEQNSDVDDEVQENNQSIETEDDDVEVTEITFDGESLDDDEGDDDTETADNQEAESGDTLDSESDDEKPLIKRLRKVVKTKSKELQSVKFELERLKKQSPQPTQSIQEPTLPRLSDYDYDDDVYQDAVKKYADDLVRYKAVQEKNVQVITNLQQAYIKQKSTLNIANFDNYENVVTSSLDIKKQNMILKTEKPALIVVALAKNPQLLSEFSNLNNDDFAYQIAKIEQKIQVNTVKKPKTKPEKLIANAKTGMSSDKTTLEALEKEAEKTGDRSKIHAFKKQQRNK